MAQITHAHPAVEGGMVNMYATPAHQAAAALLGDEELFKSHMPETTLWAALGNERPPSFFPEDESGVMPYSEVRVDDASLRSQDLVVSFGVRPGVPSSTSLECVINEVDWWKLLNVDDDAEAPSHAIYGALPLSWELLAYDTRGLSFDAALNIHTFAHKDMRSGEEVRQNWCVGGFLSAVGGAAGHATGVHIGCLLPRDTSQPHAQRKLYNLDLRHLGSPSVRSLLTVNFDQLRQRLAGYRTDDDNYAVVLGGVGDEMPRNGAAFVVTHCLSKTKDEAKKELATHQVANQDGTLRALVPSAPLDQCVEDLRLACRQEAICLARSSKLHFTLSAVNATRTQTWPADHPFPRVVVRVTYVAVPLEFTGVD